MLRRTTRALYRYQEFEMSKMAKEQNLHPFEAPNTSYFQDTHASFWMGFGYSNEEVWGDRQHRRYETQYMGLRKVILLSVVSLTMISYLPRIATQVFGDIDHEVPWMSPELRAPLDNLYIEEGGNPLNAEWLRHIHSKESY